MKHEFRASLADSNICQICKYTEIDHTNRATCEECGNSGNVDIVYGNMLMCLSCQNKERLAQIELKANAEDRVNNARVTLDKARTIDTSIQIIQDIFNAETVAIIDIKNSIDSDNNIVEKHFTLAKSIEKRHSHFQDILDASRDTIREVESKQRAIQQYYNDLANKLRIEQREQIKLKDVNYKPLEKKISKPRAPTVKKFDKAQLIKAAGEISKEFPNIPADLIMPNLQSLVISRNMNVEQAKNVLKGMFGGKM